MSDHDITEGTYIVISGTGQALDLPGAADYSGEQAQVYTLNRSSAQVVRLISTDSGWVLYWPLCGVVLSAGELDGDGRPFQGSRVVFQGNTGQDQAHWGIEYKTTEGGYDWYRITSVLDTSLAAIHEGQGSGSKVFMGDPIAGTSNMIWRFEQVQEVYDGTYQMVLASRTDLALSTDGDRATVMARGQAGLPNADIWSIGGDSSGRVAITSLNNGRDITLGSVSQSPYPVYVRDHESASNLALWTPEPLGSAEVNGEDYDAWYFRAMAGENLVLDPYGGKSSPQSAAYATNIASVTSQRQAFALVPAEALLGLTVPGDVRHVVGGVEAQTAVASGLVTAYPSWASDGESFQCRYRHRARSSGQPNGSRSAWSAWLSVADGSAYADGWGAVGEPNVDASLGDGRWVASRGATFVLASNGADLIEIEWQVRRFEREWPWRDAYVTAHGEAASARCAIAMSQTLVVDAVEVSVDGAEVSYHGNWDRGGSTVRIWSEGLFDTGQMAGVKVSDATGGSAAVARDLKSIPVDGEQAVVKWSCVTCDGVKTEGSALVAVACDISGATPMSASHVDVDGFMRRFVLQFQDAQRLWLNVGGQAVEIQPEDDGSFLVPYPMLAAWSVNAVAIDGNGVVRSFEAIPEPVGEKTAVFNWDGGWCRIDYAAESAPSLSESVKKDSSSASVSGREWGFVQVGDQRKSAVTVSGAVVTETDGDRRAAFDALSDCRFAWFRSPDGAVMRVAVTSVSMARSPYGFDVSVKMERVDA